MLLSQHIQLWQIQNAHSSLDVKLFAVIIMVVLVEVHLQLFHLHTHSTTQVRLTHFHHLF